MKHDAKEVTELIESVLYEVDPAGTFCFGNEGMEDEYENEAKEIVERFVSGNQRLSVAMKEVFESQFDGHFDQDLMRTAYRRINNALNGVDPGIEP